MRTWRTSGRIWAVMIKSGGSLKRSTWERTSIFKPWASSSSRKLRTKRERGSTSRTYTITTSLPTLTTLTTWLTLKSTIDTSTPPQISLRKSSTWESPGTSTKKMNCTKLKTWWMKWSANWRIWTPKRFYVFLGPKIDTNKASSKS